MDRDDALITELLDINAELYQKGYITPSGGNLSARSQEADNKIAITPSAVYKRLLRSEDMLWVNLEGGRVGGSQLRASLETPMHLAVYRARSDIRAVIHTHPPYANIWGLSDLPFLPVSAEAAMLRSLPVIEWTSGTAESGRRVAEAMGEGGFHVLIRNHGVVVGGPSLRWAAGVTDMIEVACRMLVTCKMMGVEPRRLPDAVVEAIQAKPWPGEWSG